MQGTRANHMDTAAPATTRREETIAAVAAALGREAKYLTLESVKVIATASAWIASERSAKDEAERAAAALRIAHGINRVSAAPEGQDQPPHTQTRNGQGAPLRQPALPDDLLPRELATPHPLAV